MINNILISKNKRKIINKYNKFIGMSGENLQEVLVFNLDEELEGQGIIELEFPDGKKGFIEIEKTEFGYELPVKSSLLTQSGQIEMQLRILQNNQEVFKSEIMEFRVKESINATETIPEQYPIWIDNLGILKANLEKAESERVTSEEARVEAESERITSEEARVEAESERIEAETQREDSFTRMQKDTEDTIKHIQDLKVDELVEDVNILVEDVNELVVLNGVIQDNLDKVNGECV